MQSKIKTNRMKFISLFIVAILFTSTVFSQCIEIEKILVDACSDNGNEGENEMVIFKIGAQALNTSTMNVGWATQSHSFPGVLQNSQTAATVAALNATIVSCGSLTEPVGGVLPANSKVLLVTSYAFEVGAHSFANLSEDLIIIFQNAARGNGGHFGNFGSSAPRDLSISFSSPSSCSDAVSYDRSLLVKQNGAVGEQDGAFVSFATNGTATYGNLGCQVPASTFSVTIAASQPTMCTGEQVTLTASGADSYVWNDGSTSNPKTVTAGGTYSIVGTSSCGTATASVAISELSAPLSIVVPSPLYSCDSNEFHSVDLSGNVCQSCTYTWSDGTTGQTYSGNEPNYSVTIQNSCGSQVVNYNYDVISVSADIFVQDTIGNAAFTVPFTSQGQGANYNWDFDNGNNSSIENPTQVFTSAGEYNIILKVSEQGCVAVDSQLIIVNGALPTEAIIPNVFTPNGDGQNDVFFIETINGTDLTGAIFNRWGKQVKELNGLTATWNGNDYHDGTYYYVVEVTFIDKSIKEYTGHIQLIK